jgi:phosphatidylglycerophosphatase A
MDRLVLCVAQGFFIGRSPIAPGTFGSLLGLGWVALLLWTGAAWIYSVACLVGILGSVWFCGQAERILGATDPGSVVLDEVTAMPVCFGSWLVLCIVRDGALPGGQALFAGSNLWWTTGIFLAFRLFDIIKPWPVRQSQALPGGWGVTIDDVLAAVYVNLAVLIAWFGLATLKQ